MLYETAARPPKAGSLKEALFLTVWLKRQEQKVQRERIAAQGLADIVKASNGESHMAEVFQKYIESVFPFLIDERKDQDRKAKEILERQAKKGVLTFDVAPENFMKERVKVMQMDDEWAQKLRNRAARKA